MFSSYFPKLDIKKLIYIIKLSETFSKQDFKTIFTSSELHLKGVFAKNERGYRRNAKNKRF